MKIEDVRGMTPDQLAEQLLSLKKEQFNLRFQQATGQVEKTHRVAEVRRTSSTLWVFSTWPVAFWKRRLNCSFFRLTSCSAS